MLLICLDRIADISASVPYDRICIPPGAQNHRLDASVTLEDSATLMRLQSHMHLRGKEFEQHIVLPNQDPLQVLRISRWNPGWQQEYSLAEPILLPKGTKLEATAWYDNSSNNKFNPDPTKEVHGGDQTFDEMMIGHFEIAVEADRDPYKLVKHRQRNQAE